MTEAVVTLAGAGNEDDEFWGETIRITKPTGEDKATSNYIIITVVSALAVIGVAVVLIKKYVFTK